MWLTALFIGFLATATTATEHFHKGVETELLAIPISPNLFNWTYQEFDQQYSFHASMEGKPELPSWLRYIYSGRHHSGFIFGTPPCGVNTPIKLQIVGLNRQDYETRVVTLTLHVVPKNNMARYEVEFKIDNLNVEDLLDEHKMSRLQDILRTKLWTESNPDLYPTFLASAIDLGARMPLKPEDGKGLVVRLGSSHQFSSELKRLREEVRPLSRLQSCPRDYKRTTVERLFRDAGFTLDWCRFELYNTMYTDRSTNHLEYLSELPNTSKPDQPASPKDIWTAPSRYALPMRSYAKQLALSVTLPLLLLVLSVAALTAVLCFHYTSMSDPESEWFIQNIFHICVDYRNKRAHKSSGVEECRYGTTDTEQTQLAGSNRTLGDSPTTTLVRPHSPRAIPALTGDYNRPQPPPYLGAALHHRKPSTSGLTPEHRNLALEESLQLLNEAKISNDFNPKDPVIDYADTAEDYVPVKPETYVTNPEICVSKPEICVSKPEVYVPKPEGFVPEVAYVPMKQDLDDIDVPELSKFGIGVEICNVTLDGLNAPVKTWFC